MEHSEQVKQEEVMPQAFIADPEKAFDLVELNEKQFNDIKKGRVTWNDLAANLDKDDSSEDDKSNEVFGPGYMRRIEPSRASQEAWDQGRRVWEQHGAIAPPFEKDLLCRIARSSGVLQECIQTYCTVIEGFGHTFIPVLDPDADDSVDQVKNALWMRRIEESEDPKSLEADFEPTDEEVEQELNRIRRQIKFQKMKAIRFFRNAARIMGEPCGFIQLRQLLRKDKETMGEWYFEVLEDDQGNIKRLSYLPSVSMRKMPLDREMTEVEVVERVDDFETVKVKEYRHFRRYLQYSPEGQAHRYFKELGDPRVLSSKTGKYFKDHDAFQEAEPGELAATQVVCDTIPDSETPYGVVRWIANSPAIGGSRKAEEVNFTYFDNKTIPPYMILVSGGRLNPQAQKTISTHLKQLKGSDNFHKLLVLEAQPFGNNLPGQPPQRVTIEVVPLIKFMNQDGLFLNYLVFNDTRIGANFSCPPLLRGRSSEYTRATARETLRFFEKMVAYLERLRFDEIMNTKILPALGLNLIKYSSLGADTSDPEVMTALLDVLLKHGAIVPQDARQEAESLLTRELPRINEQWVTRPLKMTVAEMATRSNQPADAPEIATPGTEPINPEKINKMREYLQDSVLRDLGFEGGRGWIEDVIEG